LHATGVPILSIVYDIGSVEGLLIAPPR